MAIIDFFEAKKRIEEKEEKQKVERAATKETKSTETTTKTKITEYPQCEVSFSSRHNIVFFYEINSDGKRKYIAQSSVRLGKRFFSRKAPSSPAIEAKDCTPNKIKKNPNFFILKYLPEWEGKAVLIGSPARPIITLNKADGIAKAAPKKIDVSKLDFKFKIGDIVYTCYGYDQTNTDFFQIVGRTDRTAKVREIASEFVKSWDHSDSARIKPVKGKFVGTIKTCRINISDNKEVSLCNVDGFNNGRLTSENESHSISRGH